MAALTEKLLVFRFLDGAAGFRNGRTYPLRYQVLDDGRISIEKDHLLDEHGQPRPGLEPLVLDGAIFKQWFTPA